MKMKIKETKLTDGSKVFDVNIFPNGGVSYDPKVILTCEDEYHATKLFLAINRAITDFSMEDVEEV